MNSFFWIAFGILIIAANNLVQCLMWSHNPYGSQQPGLYYGRYTNQNYNNKLKPYNMNAGWYETNWNHQTGNTKGSNNRRCYESRHCSAGECCQFYGYSNIGSCVQNGYFNSYGCIEQRPRDPSWFQRPITNGNNKGGITSQMQIGRPGSCPPYTSQHHSQQYCKQDLECPTYKKCCSFQGKTMCVSPIFA